MASPSVVQTFKNRTSPNIIPISTPPPQEITQLELTKLRSLRNQAKQIETDIADSERSIKDRLEAGGYVEPASALQRSKRTPVEVFLGATLPSALRDKLFGSGKGDAYCERVLRSTKPTTSVSLIVT